MCFPFALPLGLKNKALVFLLLLLFLDLPPSLVVAPGISAKMQHLDVTSMVVYYCADLSFKRQTVHKLTCLYYYLKKNLSIYIMVLKCNFTTGVVARIILFICFILTIIEAAGGCCSSLNALFCVLNIYNNSNNTGFSWHFPFLFLHFIIRKVFMDFTYTTYLQSVVGTWIWNPSLRQWCKMLKNHKIMSFVSFQGDA